ncbi:MAG TPA: FAD-binding oxidoreductase [Thermomicrobiaceae bacterium]|nr:FAD-binding oxidoreductase [Thermomicrobiaceae bacterium]
MAETADVVVIGAGANGTSTAFHLAGMGAGKVVVVERYHLAAGATGKSGALVRTHYTNEPETRLGVESMRYFANWGDLVGGDCGFQRIGLLTFAAPEFTHNLEANVATQRELGVDASVITPEEALELDPALYVGDVDAVAYEPGAGYADPNATVFGFARAAMERGVEFKLGTRATRILTEGDRVTGVETTAGVVEAPVVVITAGAWANQLFEPLGIDLGLVPVLARVTLFRWAAERSPRHLTYIDHFNDTWARPVDGNCTLIGAESGVRVNKDPESYPEAVEQDYIEVCRQKLINRWPVMARSTVRGNWSGILMMSPDARPIIDKLPHYEGLYTMTGDSGTSFKTAPAIGKGLAEWITAGSPKTVDLSPFGAARVLEGRLWEDEHYYGLHRGTVSR